MKSLLLDWKKNLVGFLLLTCAFGAPLYGMQIAQDGHGTDRDYETSEKLARSIYKSAHKEFKKKKYWDAALDLIFILDFYPHFTALDRAVLLLGNSMYEMGIYRGADKMYRYILKSIPKTDLLPQAILGLQKVHYQLGHYQKSLKFYTALESHFPRDKVMDESHYYAGETFYHMKNYSMVESTMQLVGKKSEFYPFALYTSALTDLKKKESGRRSPSSYRFPGPRQKMRRDGSWSMIPV